MVIKLKLKRELTWLRQPRWLVSKVWPVLNLLRGFQVVLVVLSLWMLVPMVARLPISWFLLRFLQKMVIFVRLTQGICVLVIVVQCSKKQVKWLSQLNLTSNQEITSKSRMRWIVLIICESLNNLLNTLHVVRSLNAHQVILRVSLLWKLISRDIVSVVLRCQLSMLDSWSMLITEQLKTMKTLLQMSSLRLRKIQVLH